MQGNEALGGLADAGQRDIQTPTAPTELEIEEWFLYTSDDLAQVSGSAPPTSRSAAPEVTTPPSTDASTPSAAPAPPDVDPAALNDRGKALIDAGEPAAAVPVLERSVQRYRETSRASGLPYAFALYNLGNALRLAGRPGDAVPVLEERLRVSDNQRPAVERELALARQQAGIS